MNSFAFSKFAKKNFGRLEAHIQERIRAKLKELKTHQYIESVLKPLTDFGPATHRLRVRDYRVIVQQISETDFLIIDVGHRSNVYR